MNSDDGVDRFGGDGSVNPIPALKKLKKSVNWTLISYLAKYFLTRRSATAP